MIEALLLSVSALKSRLEKQTELSAEIPFVPSPPIQGGGPEQTGGKIKIVRERSSSYSGVGFSTNFGGTRKHVYGAIRQSSRCVALMSGRPPSEKRKA